MNARREGWVTVAAASAALSAAGDTIDPSNVSRYLTRFPDIPQEKSGRCRFVDLKALADHRNVNVLVGEKRVARDLFDAGAAPREAAPPDMADDDEDEGEGDSKRQPSETSAAQLQLRQLQIREKEADWAERIGKLVPDHEVLSLVAGCMAAFVAELERQEALIAAGHGREVAVLFRKARKAAQAAASAKLIELGRQHLKPEAAAQLIGEPDTAAA